MNDIKINSKQQQETFEYFNKTAIAWEEKAFSEGKKQVNINKQINEYTLNIIDKRDSTKFMLDLACGVGDLVCDFARRNIEALGVDFSEKMISLAKSKAKKDNLKNAHFYCNSIFDFDLSQEKYDIVSANGFIQFISVDEFNDFLDLSYKAMTDDGSLIFDSRNRLFNIFSLNNFTISEIEKGTALQLLKESIALTSGNDISELFKIETTPFQEASMEHPKTTKINIATRYQYTPAQIVQILKQKGFETVQIYPFHIHGVKPAFKDKHPTVHTLISNQLQNYADNDLSLVPHSTSFIVHAKKYRNLINQGDL